MNWKTNTNRCEWFKRGSEDFGVKDHSKARRVTL